MRPMGVLIVDDDALSRLNLKRYILCMEPEYYLAGEVKDGHKALEFCMKNHVDIVITDMKMPGMDGLTLIDSLRHLKVSPAVIALSGYDEYGLVRNALRGGAVDYILKLELCAQKLYECLEEIRKASLDNICGEDVNLPVKESKEAVLYELTHFRMAESQSMSRRLQEAGCIFRTDCVYGLIVKAHELYRFENVDQEEYALLQYSLLSILRETLEDCVTAYAFSGRTGEFFAFAELSGEAKEHREELEKLCRRMLGTVSEYLDLNCSVGIGKGGKEVAGLSQAAFQAKQAVRYRFYHKEPIIWFEDCCQMLKPAEQTRSGISGFRHSLENEIALGNTDAVKSIFEKMKDRIEQKRPAPDLLYSDCISISAGLYEFCTKYNIQPEEMMAHSQRMPQEFMAMESADRVIEWLEGLEHDLMVYIKKTSSSERNTLLRRADEYIAQNYGQEDVSLQSVAEVFGLSPGYFNMLIKKQSGETFSKRLTSCRIQEAKRLLRNTDQRIHEIGEAVGIQDPFYFSRLFKRYVGCSPAEYRSGMGEKSDETD